MDKFSVQNLNRWPDFALVVLLPVFFLPASPVAAGADEFNKGFLLFILVPAAIAVWLIGQWRQGKASVRFDAFDALWGAFVLIAVISSAFGLDFGVSFFGSPAAMSAPLINLILFGLFFIYLKQRLKSEIDRLYCWRLVALGAGVSTAVFALTAFWPGISSASVGTVSQFAPFLAMALAAFLPQAADPARIKVLFDRHWQRVVFGIFYAGALALLALVNSALAWWLLALAAALYFFGNLRQLGKNAWRSNIAPAALLVLSFIFLSYNYSSIDQALAERRLAGEIKPGLSRSLVIARAALASQPLLGLGNGHFPYAASLWREASWNQSPYWQARYIDSSSFIAGAAAANGWLGSLPLLAFIAYVIFSAVKTLFFNIDASAPDGRSDVSAGLSALIGAFALLVSAPALPFFILFFGLLALWLSSVKDSVKAWQFHIISIEKSKNPFIFLAWVAGLAWVILLIIIAKDWIAGLNYASAKNEAATVLNEKRFDRAVKLDPGEAMYRAALAKRISGRAMDLVKAGDEESLKQGAQLMNETAGHLDAAIKAAPYSVAVYEAKAAIYRDLALHSPESAKVAAAAFLEARKLEPANPVLALELGKLYLDYQNPSAALAQLEEAVVRKPDLYDARFQLGRAYAANGKEDAALKLFAALSKERSDPDIAYEEGKAYYSQKDYAQAIGKFNQAVAVRPLYANALYFLALSHEQAGNKSEALYYLKKVSELNPENIEVKQKMEDLQQ